MSQDQNEPLVRSKHGFLTTQTESRRKAATKRRNTKPEVLLRKALWHKGYRYRINLPSLPGKPDIVFRRSQVAVFVDGDFWHGRDWPVRKKKLGRNRDYWIRKIENNIARDVIQEHQLRELGWTVLRFWSTDVMKDAVACAARVEAALQERSVP